MSELRVSLALSVLVAIALGGCNRSGESPESAPAPAPAPTETAPEVAPQATPGQPMDDQLANAPASTAAIAHVDLQPTEGNTAMGNLELRVENDAVRISGRLSGLAPDTDHGFHVHETGDCSAPDASSAGPHFNPASQPHGNPETGPHHAGDIPNQRSDASGNADVNVLVRGIELGTGGATDVVGRALIVHAKADDYTSQPSGDSGARIACGVIERSGG